jgi:hypothetical protein
MSAFAYQGAGIVFRRDAQHRFTGIQPDAIKLALAVGEDDRDQAAFQGGVDQAGHAVSPMPAPLDQRPNEKPPKKNRAPKKIAPRVAPGAVLIDRLERALAVPGRQAGRVAV